MPDQDTPGGNILHDTLTAYFAAIASMDSARIASCFSPAGEIEDPIGTGVVVGRAAVQAYFARGIGTLASHVEIEVLGEFAAGDRIAAHWRMLARGHAGGEAGAEGVDVIYVNRDGEIRRAEGYWDAPAFRRALAAS